MPSHVSEAGLAIAALRERGAHRLDPVRFRYIEALARRAQAHGGAGRVVLDAKLAEALVQYGQRHCAPPSRPATVAAPPPGPLAGLVQHIARHAPEHRHAHGQSSGQASAGRGATLPAARAAEPQALGYFRSTWAKLRLAQQLSLSLAKQPQNAGPLNSHRLVLRSLQVMRDISPAYLGRFMAYVDALQWLDQAGTASAAVPDHAARAEGDKKRKPGRSRAA